MMRTAVLLTAGVGIAAVLLAQPPSETATEDLESLTTRLAQMQDRKGDLERQRDELNRELDSLSTAIEDISLQVIAKEALDHGFFVEGVPLQIYSEDSIQSKRLVVSDRSWVGPGLGSHWFKVADEFGTVGGFAYIPSRFNEGKANSPAALGYAASLEEMNKAANQRLRERLEAKRRADEALHEAVLAQGRQELVSKYGDLAASRILKGQYWIGMTREMAIDSIGRPSRNNRTITGSIVHEQWVYRDGDLLLYFENGVLTAWQD